MKILYTETYLFAVICTLSAGIKPLLNSHGVKNTGGQNKEGGIIFAQAALKTAIHYKK